MFKIQARYLQGQPATARQRQISSHFARWKVLIIVRLRTHREVVQSRRADASKIFHSIGGRETQSGGRRASDPQRSSMDAAAAGGKDAWIRAGRIATIPKPQPGQWILRLLGTGAGAFEPAFGHGGGERKRSEGRTGPGHYGAAFPAAERSRTAPDDRPAPGRA